MPARIRLAASRATLLVSLISFAGCQTAPPRAPSFTERVAAAHGIDDWNAEQALQGELLARFEDEDSVIDLRFVIEIDGPRVRIAVGDGTPEAKLTTLLYDGKNLSVSPDAPAPRDPQTIVHMWSTVIALPFRLTSPELRVEQVGTRQLGTTNYDVAKITFPNPIPGLGDWLLLYTDETRLLKALVYSTDDTPRAISFYDFEDISGVKLPTEWKFWRWTEAEGIHDKPTGTARLFNLGFTTVGSLRRPRPSVSE